MGEIVTFYSFKGGVGRSMSLANIAVILGKMNKKVLMIDWDLEAPGLDKYITDYISHYPSTGLLDLLHEAKNNQSLNWKKYIVSLQGFEGSQNISFMPSGLVSDNYEEYLRKLSELNWEDFFEKYDGGLFLEKMRTSWSQEFDFVLIDSRTGISDSGGVCTILLPDIIIPLFTGNEQSLIGIKNVIKKAQEARQSIIFDRLNATILPVFSRFEGSVEYELSKKWLIRASKELNDFYLDWMPNKSKINILNILDKTKIPYVPYYSFGESLAVIEDELKGGDFSGMINSYLYIAYLLATDMYRVEDIFDYATDSLIDRAKSNSKKHTASSKNFKKTMDIKDFSFNSLNHESSYSILSSNLEGKNSTEPVKFIFDYQIFLNELISTERKNNV